MGKDKSRSKMKKGVKKKTFLDNQKRHRNDVKVSRKKLGEDAGGVEAPCPQHGRRAFRFQNFSDQVAGVDSSIVYQLAGIGKISISDPDSVNSSIFAQTLAFWRDLNLTTRFCATDKQLARFVSLPLVLVGQQQIVDVLCTHLAEASVLDIQPVLELTSALATDLQQEFYPHLSRVLSVLMSRPLARRDAQVIQWSLRCLGHLLKTLWRAVLPHLPQLYIQLQQLFSTTRPDFIRHLGAETVAFLLRKAPDKAAFLTHILQSRAPDTDPQALAKLFFEAISTVNEQFNSHAKVLWPLYLEQLAGDPASGILYHVFQFCGEHSSRAHLAPLLQASMGALATYSGAGDTAAVNYLLKCLTIQVQLKAGALIGQPELILDFLEASELGSSEVVELVAALLTADKLLLPMARVETLLAAILASTHFPLHRKLSLVTRFSSHPLFTSCLLKPYLALVQAELARDPAMLPHLAATLRQASPPCSQGASLLSWRPVTLDLQLVRQVRQLPKDQVFTARILQLIHADNPTDTVLDALTCAASIKPMEKTAVLSAISALVAAVRGPALAEILPAAIATAVSLGGTAIFGSTVPEQTVMDAFLASPGAKNSIRSLDFLLSCTSLPHTCITDTVRDEVLGLLMTNLSCPDGEVRQLCLHSMLLLLPLLGDKVTEVKQENGLSFQALVSTLLEAEQQPDSLTHYKDKLNKLERTEWSRVAEVLEAVPSLALTPVHYYLGLLYTNFTLLWAPLASLLASHGSGLPSSTFWPVFLDKLQGAGRDVQQQLAELQQEGEVRQEGRRTDHINYRNQLWGLMAGFPAVAEARNRDLVPLFLDTFMQGEYVTIRKLSDDLKAEGSKPEGGQTKAAVKSTVKSLLSHLGVLVNFKDLKSLYRGAEVRQLVYSLLSHKLAPVQKASLQILAAYKLKFLQPYRENLFRLLEEKDFKAELLSFPLAGEDSPIKAEHREELLPVILRLLYGRMRSVKSGKKAGGKAQVSARRGLVLHHMMVLPELELQQFFHLVFKDLFDAGQAESDLFSHVVSGAALPVRGSQQMQACVEMVQVILSKLGKLLSPASLSYLLSILLWLAAVTQAQIDLHSSSPLRSLRNTLFSTLAGFYTKNDCFEPSVQEQEAVEQVFLWRLLGSFETDFIHSSSGLLVLLLAWSRDKRTRPVFLKRHPDSGAGVLATLCRVLNKPTTNVKVVDSVLDIVHNLVREEEPEEGGEVEEDERKEQVDVVLVEMETILVHFGSWIRAANANLKAMRKVGIKLDILACIAPYITQPDTALELFRQLVILSNSLKKSDTVIKVLAISKLLMVHIEKDKVKDVVVDLVPFFGKMTNRKERAELGQIFENSAVSDPSLELTARICVELNSFDRKRMEEPDFERRMAIFKRVRDELKQGGGLGELELTAVIYNCSYYLKYEADSSLKTNALEALVNVAKLLQKVSEEKPLLAKKLVDRVCLGLIRTGLKAKEDGVRVDFLSFLQALVQHCGQASPRVKDLAGLQDADPDLDFFENMRHVQLHRRGRAMARLAKRLQGEPGLLKRANLSQVVLPLATVYLLTDNYSKNSQLVEQAIELVGAVNSTLPWQYYENNIKYYLELFAKEIQHQKQLVKIVTAILDAFHFDLNKDEAKPTVPVVEEDEEKKEANDVEMEDGEDDLQSKNTEKSRALRERIFNTVNNVLLPKLHATLSGKTKGPTAISDEDKLILRVPLAVPIVKMLKIMSLRALYRAVPGIISKIASFLKSKAVEVREAARATLCSVALQLGPRCVATVVKELQAQLLRGYQLHILTYTVHSVLHTLGQGDQLKPGDLDSTCPQVVEICLSEMFGVISEEKDVKKITGKLLEARGTKSYDSLQLLARFISNSKLMALVRPIADKCATFSTFKNLTKIRECFRNIVLGLLGNTALDPLNTLVFIYGVTTDKLVLGNTGLKERNGLAKVKQQESIFIVQKAPRRQGETTAKTSKSASQHVVHEFGLNLLNFLLKRSSLLATEVEHCARLQPFLPILMAFLTSPHVTLITASLRALLWILKFPLPGLDRAKILEFTNKVFDLLNKFGAGTDGKGENHDLVVVASKLLVVLIRDVELTQLDQNHLKTILDYVVTDVMDPFKSTTAFGLLSAIVGRNLASPELHDVMLRMVELSVQSSSGQTRAAARSTVVSYVTNYNLKKKLGKLLELYAGQLGYELVSGRLAAAESLRSLIPVLGAASLEAQAQFLFFSLGPRLLNDDSPEVRKAVAASLGVLLKTASPGAVQGLLRPTLTWLQARDNPGHAQLAAHLLCIFLDQLGVTLLKPHLDSVLEAVVRHLVSPQDHLALQALQLATRLVRLGGQEAKLGLQAGEARLAPLWAAVHTLLLHSHAWVRLLACQLVGLYLALVPATQLLAIVTTGGSWPRGPDTVRGLVLDLLEQLSLSQEADSELGTQVTKNLVALAKLLLLEGWQGLGVEASFHWMVKKAVKVANQELISSPKVKARRTLVFSLVAACCLDASEEAVVSVLPLVLLPLHREVSSTGPEPELRNHCQEVLDLIKTKVDPDVFSDKYMEVQLNLAKRKGERVAQKKQNYVLNPKLAAKRKIQQNEAKKKAKRSKSNANIG